MVKVGMEQDMVCGGGDGGEGGMMMELAEGMSGGGMWLLVHEG